MISPKFSIICPVYNNAKGLQETLQSIDSQTYNDYEIIIIDAASSDNTTEIIKSHPQKITFWSSEPDKSIYDGMNKGVQKASGEWLVFMNGGDIFYEPKTLEKVATELTDSLDIVFGENMHRYENGTMTKRKHKGLAHLWKGMQFSHQSMYIRREIMLEYPYDIKFRLAADYDLVMHCVHTHKRFKKLDFPLSITEAGGRSDKKRVQLFEEHLEIYRRYERNIFKETALLARLSLARLRQAISA